MNDTFKPIQRLEDRLNSVVLERQREVRGAMVSMLAGEHILLLGPPGSGKTFMGRVFDAAVDGAKGFSNTMTKFSTPDELVGMFDPKLMMEGRIRRRTEGMLPEADSARIEEIFKSNAACLGTLTDILCDGVFKQEGKDEKVNTVLVIGTSNELPEDESLAYLWDRFALRFWVGYLQDRGNKLKALKGRKNGIPQGAVCELSDLHTARGVVKNTPIGDELLEAAIEVTDALEKAGYVLSDRRRARVCELIHADMLAFDASLEDGLLHFADAAWSAPEDRVRILQIVSRVANPLLGEAQEILDAAKEIMAAVRDSENKYNQTGDQASFLSGVAAANKTLQQQRNAVRVLDPQKKSRKVQELCEQVDAMQKLVAETLQRVLRG